jgi:hypothetical protein
MPADGPVAGPGEAGPLGSGTGGPEAPLTETPLPTDGHSAVAVPWPRRWLVAFGRFWWDFLVGDTPELLIGVLIALGVVALLVKAAGLNAVAVVGFPLMVAVMLGLSVYRARPKQ